MAKIPPWPVADEFRMDVANFETTWNPQNFILVNARANQFRTVIYSREDEVLHFVKPMYCMNSGA